MKQFIFLPILIKKIQFALLIYISVTFICSQVASANNWQAPVYKSVLPQKIVAVDKSNQLFHYIEENSPTALQYTFDCTTGQIDGAKQTMNDLKTPEGVYFVQYKITDGLDFVEYGGTAYTLNYPNPVDRLMGKTGYGIWIHSKGLGIKPKDTRGCIAIGLDELEKIGSKLSYGTAVLLAETVKIEDLPKDDLGTATNLINKMDKWTKAWAARSGSMFKMYDQDAYSKAMQESFTAFKANKVYLFGILPWINIFNKEIHVLEGPGYWVTWSEQFYRAPNLSTEGIRRLYWKLDDKNEYKIVGMEWIPRNLGMKADYLNGKLVATNTNSKISTKSSEEPVLPALSMPERGDTDPTDQNNKETDTRKSPTLNVQVEGILHNKMTAWLNAWQTQSSEFFNYYDQGKFGKISYLSNKTAADSKNNDFIILKNNMKDHFSAKWLEITFRPISIDTNNKYLYTQSELFIRSHTQDPMQGILRLYWDKDNKGDYLIVDSLWQDKELGMKADHIKKVESVVNKFIVDWQKAWLSADVNAYSEFYASNATQQNLIGKVNITSHKRNIWKISKPKELELSKISILLDPQGLIVNMTQHYANSKGYTDVGTKTLLLQPTNNSYLILDEQWVPMKN